MDRVLLWIIDELSRKYLDAKETVITERGPEPIHEGCWALLHEVNELRTRAGLPPVKAPSHWLPENYFEE